jgi:hypothetical protein
MEGMSESPESRDEPIPLPLIDEWAALCTSRFMRDGIRPVVVASEPPESFLLLDLAREAFRQQVAKRVRPLSRSYVERWMGCELWLYTSVVQRHGNELHSYKAVVLETLRKTNLDDMLSICRTTRPDLDDLWKRPAARDKLRKEVDKAIEAVQAL